MTWEIARSEMSRAEGGSRSHPESELTRYEYCSASSALAASSVRRVSGGSPTTTRSAPRMALPISIALGVVTRIAATGTKANWSLAFHGFSRPGFGGGGAGCAVDCARTSNPTFRNAASVTGGFAFISLERSAPGASKHSAIATAYRLVGSKICTATREILSKLLNKKVWLPGMDSIHELDRFLKACKLLISQSR